MMSRPVIDYFRAHKIVYVITNQRALVMQLGKRKRIRSYDLSEIDQVTRVEKTDGSGNLYFSTSGSGVAVTPSQARFSRAGFKAINDVKIAESYLQAGRKKDD